MANLTNVKERRELQALEGKAAWAEYQGQAEATREKTERLRAARLAKLADVAKTEEMPATKKKEALSKKKRLAA